MKVEQLNNVQIDWTKPQVVVSKNGRRFQTVINQMPKNEFSFCAVDLESGDYKNNYSKAAFKPETLTDYPIELKLTIEKPEELCSLLHRTSIKSCRIDENRVYNLTFLSDDSDEVLHHLLEQLAKERNLFKND